MKQMYEMNRLEYAGLLNYRIAAGREKKDYNLIDQELKATISALNELVDLCEKEHISMKEGVDETRDLWFNETGKWITLDDDIPESTMFSEYLKWQQDRLETTRIILKTKPGRDIYEALRKLTDTLVEKEYTNVCDSLQKGCYEKIIIEV